MNRVVFTEPEVPEEDRFQPLPIPPEVTFINNSFQPPFHELAVPNIPLPPHTLPGGGAVYVEPPPPLEMVFPPAAGSAPDFRTLVLAALQPAPEALVFANMLTELCIAYQVPLLDFRNQIPIDFGPYYMDQFSATHTLHLIDPAGQSVAFPIHFLVIASQCLRFSWIQQTWGTDVLVHNVPDLMSFPILLRWLYARDVAELDVMLRQDVGMLWGFAQNCQFWGIIEEGVTTVVTAILQDLE